MQLFEEPKKVGRPRVIDPNHTRIEGRFTHSELALIDAFRERLSAQTGKPVSRAGALRALALRALAQEENSMS